MATGKESSVSWLDYRPRGRGLDIEIFPFAEMRHRATPARLRATHRYAFHLLICVTDGLSTQLVDFEPVVLRPGALLVLRPGQVHNFGLEQGWEGWVVPFRAEFLPTAAALDLDRLADHLSLSPSDLAAVTETISRMQQDAARDAAPNDLHALLRYQLCGLLQRLMILQDRPQGTGMRSRGRERFAQFAKLVEDYHTRWHQVEPYADMLGCTQKSLTRAALEATGRGAKEVIAARIALEAKRLLAHTEMHIYLVAESLGFHEATNFSKFFRREAGCSPAEFRRRHRQVTTLELKHP